MGGVGREAAHLAERVLQTGQHAVERLGQTVELVAGAAHPYAARQRLGVDAPGRLRHVVHGLERGARHHAPAGRRQAHAEWNEHGQGLHPALQRALGRPQRDADLHDLDEAAVASHRQRDDAHAPVVQHHRVERRPALDHALPRGRRQRQRVAAQATRAKAERAVGIEELEELVLGVEELAQPLLGHVETLAAARGVAHDLGHRQQRAIDVLGKTPRQQRVRQPADDDEDGEQGAGIPERQPRVDRERATRHGSSVRST